MLSSKGLKKIKLNVNRLAFMHLHTMGTATLGLKIFPDFLTRFLLMYLKINVENYLNILFKY